MPRVTSPQATIIKGTGTLVVVGGGWLPVVVRDRFLELAGGKKARVIIIPTASSQADLGIETLRSYAYWRDPRVTSQVASVSFLHTRKSGQANDPNFVKPLSQATGVWLSGGDQSLLVGAYRGTAVEKELQKLLTRGGVIGGTSAGAAVMSPLMITGGNPVARTGAGFGFFPGVVIDQHFAERKRLTRLLGVLAQFPQYLGVGIDEQTAIEVHGRRLTVLGNANVRVCLPPSTGRQPEIKVFKSGELIDLSTLGQAVTAQVQMPHAQEDATSSGSATLSHGMGNR